MTDQTAGQQPGGEKRAHVAAGGNTPRLKFTGGTAFQAVLRRRVEAYFQESGRRRRDSVQMYVKAALILAVCAASYALLVFAAQAWWQAVPLAVLLGLSVAAIGFNLMHDGGHGAFSRFGFVNRWMARTLDLVGGSSYLWQWKHGVFHHTYPNLTGQDTDVALGRLARFTPHQSLYAHQRWQHWYMWPLYGVMAIKWHFYDDFRDLAMGRIGPHRIPRPRSRELAILLGGKVLFFTLAFGIPLLFHPWWVVALFYGLASLVLGIVLSVVFQLAHCVEEADFPSTPAGTDRLDAAWAAHQVETSVNFSRRSRVATWLLGGLNYQIEHHLFPRVCHTNYPALSALVERTSREFGVRYSQHRSFWAGVRSHFRWLRRMGSPGAIA